MGDSREVSRRPWNFSIDNAAETINCGSLQRIADACDLMAKNHSQLIADRDRFELYWKEERATRERRDRTISALNGVITKLKRGAN